MKKQCTGCSKIKDSSWFNKCTKSSDKLQYKCRDCEKDYYVKNKEKRSFSRKKYYQENNVRRISYQKSYYSSLAGRLSSCKSSAKRRKISFKLTDKFTMELLSKPCFVKGCMDTVTGLDRIDPAKSYTIDNVRPCCEGHNIIRLDYSDMEFYKLAKSYIDWFENSNSFGREN